VPGSTEGRLRARILALPHSVALVALSNWGKPEEGPDLPRIGRRSAERGCQGGPGRPFFGGNGLARVRARERDRSSRYAAPKGRV